MTASDRSPIAGTVPHSDGRKRVADIPAIPVPQDQDGALYLSTGLHIGGIHLPVDSSPGPIVRARSDHFRSLKAALYASIASSEKAAGSATQDLRNGRDTGPDHGRSSIRAALGLCRNCQ